MQVKFDRFMARLDENAKQVKDYIISHEMKDVTHRDMLESVIHYTNLGGKRLRPFAVTASCGAAGGDIDKALPLAAAVEMYHTWTLIHDDIIDEDNHRRSGETVHYKWSKVARASYGFSDEQASHYGLTVGILAGDLQKGWSVSGLLPELYYEKGLKPELVLELVRELDYNTLQTLVDGEILDVFYSQKKLDQITEKEVIDMLWRKTGVLYRFCGMGGAMVGLNTSNKEDRIVKKLSEFTSRCGIAFQIWDDILGLIGREEELGKPVGSDVRQGKRTLAVLEAYRSIKSEKERKLFSTVLGNTHATPEQIAEFTDVVNRLGINHAKRWAKAYVDGDTINGQRVEGAKAYLNGIPESEHKDLLLDWAEYLISRTR